MDLRLAQARYRFGMLWGTDLVAAALRLIEEGSENPTACELACLRNPTLRDAGPLFERVLRELSCAEQSPAEAWWIVVEDIARQVVGGSMVPRDGAAEMWELFYRSDRPEPDGPEYVRAAAGLRYAYDEDWPGYPGGRAAYNAALDEQVVDACRELLSVRGSR